MDNELPKPCILTLDDGRQVIALGKLVSVPSWGSTDTKRVYVVIDRHDMPADIIAKMPDPHMYGSDYFQALVPAAQVDFTNPPHTAFRVVWREDDSIWHINDGATIYDIRRGMKRPLSTT